MKFTSFVKSSALKRAGAVTLTLALGAGLVGCGGNGAGGAVAATVNGQDIMEQTVTDYVAQFRTDSGLESDDAWGEWMVSNNYTPETVREEVIEYYIKQDLYNQAASEYNVTVEQADIDEAMEQTKAMFESDEAFQEALEASGMTEESYIETNLRPRLLESKLAEAVAAAENGDGDEALLAQAQSVSDQFNGAKRTSHILLTAEGDETDEALQARAQALIDQINAGTISFEDAVAQNSQDTGSVEGAGDVGWDILNSFVTEYTDAVAGLNKGDMTAAPVKSEFGYHIIKCTDVFEVPEGGITSLDQLPAEFVDALRSMQSASATQNFTTWFQEYREKAEVTINPMPEGLPYAIDIAPYQQAAEAEQQTPEGDTATDPTAADDQAAAEGEAAAADQAAAEGDQAAAEGDQAAADADQAAADQAAADQAGDAADQAAAEGDQAAAEGDQAAADANQGAADQAADQAAADQAAAEGDAAQQ
ncbi:peptidylprolyl isomerase [Eggerthellaceae bacterium 24-137]